MLPGQQDILSAPSDSVIFNELNLKQALLDLLDEKRFLPEGGTIGFGLLHKYPVSKTKGTLESVLKCLKGSDAAIRRVCASLGLELSPKVIYKEKENGGEEFEHGEYDDVRYQYQEVWWLTKRTELTRERTDFMAFGNEAELAHTYGDVVLIASVGGHANRQTVVG
jgi:hypothetical protein